MSKNAEGWIRHRGGKCPVEKGARVDVRYRDGEISMNQPALEKGDPSEPWAEDWSHDNCAADIMAYKLHKPAEQVSAMEKIANECGALSNLANKLERNLSGPLQWRDRITEIDATTHALTAERAELVQKLASEGLALIGRAVELVDDMSDPKNWREGDCFVQTAEDVHGAKKGELWVMSQDDGTTAKAYVRENGDEWYVANSYLKFHSRPSA